MEKLFSSLESTKWLNFYPDSYAGTSSINSPFPKNIGLKWPSYICSNDINYLNSFFENKRERILELMDQGCITKSQKDCALKCGDRFSLAPSDANTGNFCPVASAAYQVRCSVVGKEYFVGRIKSEINPDGQRLASSPHYSAIIQPPKSIKMKVIRIMDELNLTHGVFDFMVTESNEWFFDALNPIGQYEWIEDINGADISSSIAKWLMSNN